MSIHAPCGFFCDLKPWMGIHMNKTPKRTSLLEDVIWRRDHQNRSTVARPTHVTKEVKTKEKQRKKLPIHSDHPCRQIKAEIPYMGGGSKFAIPLCFVHCLVQGGPKKWYLSYITLHCTRGITFLAHPVYQSQLALPYKPRLSNVCQTEVTR